MEKLVGIWENSWPLALSTVILGLSTIGYAAFKSWAGPPNGLVYPPGPPQDLIIGNFRSFPKGGDDLYAAFNKWQKQYGDIVYLRMPGVSMVVINSIDMAHELLSKRGSTTSGRTVPYMAKELLGWNWVLTFIQADSIHQQIRKMLRRGIGPQRVSSHDPLIETSARQLLVTLKGLKGDPTQPIMNAIGQVIIQLTYGNQIWEKHGPELLAINIEALHIVTASFGKVWLVDIFPQLRFIPSWMPGAEFKRQGIRSTKLVNRIRNWPFQMSKTLYETQTLGHSLAADLFEEFGQTGTVRDGLAVLYAGGADTTSSAVIHFLHCMFLFPNIAARVQKEIETVVGDRLPAITDRDDLVYTEAVWKESMRWNPPFPTGIPHTNAQDEIIDGYFIPKGSIINANIGFMLNDPKIWGDPEVFRPERHLGYHQPPLPNPASLIFGFGMRICPGKEIANRSGFYMSSIIMAIYSILPLEGKSLPDATTVEYTTSVIRYPNKFECMFVPRNETAANLLSTLAVS